MKTKNILREYERLSTVYDRKWSRYLQATLDKAIEYCSLNGQEDVLDVACGTGELEKKLINAYPNLKITGCDISSDMLRVARDKLSGYNNLSFIECSADKIPLEDSSKDIIVCCNSFHFFKEPKNVLNECSRILRKNGRIFILDWCRDFWVCRLLESLKNNFDKAHQRIYTVNELTSLLSAYNFKILVSLRFKVDWFWGMMALSGTKII